MDFNWIQSCEISAALFIKSGGENDSTGWSQYCPGARFTSLCKPTRQLTPFRFKSPRLGFLQTNAYKFVLIKVVFYLLWVHIHRQPNWAHVDTIVSSLFNTSLCGPVLQSKQLTQVLYELSGFNKPWCSRITLGSDDPSSFFNSAVISNTWKKRVFNHMQHPTDQEQCIWHKMKSLIPMGIMTAAKNIQWGERDEIKAHHTTRKEKKIKYKRNTIKSIKILY